MIKEEIIQVLEQAKTNVTVLCTIKKELDKADLFDTLIEFNNYYYDKKLTHEHDIGSSCNPDIRMADTRFSNNSYHFLTDYDKHYTNTEKLIMLVLFLKPISQDEINNSLDFVIEHFESDWGLSNESI